MKTDYTLNDTFNRCVISRHRSIEAAVAARARHSRAVRRRNGGDSYLTYSIKADDGSDISEQVFACEEAGK